MKNYFCIENIAKKKINILEITGKNVEYSFDTVNWVALNKRELKFHERKLYLRSTSVSRINCKTYFKISGNIMSLVYGDKFTGDETTFNSNTCFYRLFADDSYLLNASNLILPATTLTDHCYQGMFCDCTSLTTTPQLPATKLAKACYNNMFRRCTSLKSAPELPSTTLADYCYNNMFWGCTSLTNAPELPSTLADYCYAGMFKGCTSLTVAPKLPATELTYGCYYDMFNGCTSLTKAPELPATEFKLAKACYTGMFYDCTSLNNITINITQSWDRRNTIGWLRNVSTHGIIYNKGKVKDIPLNSVGGCPPGWTIKEID